MTTATSKCCVQACGLTCDREAGHPGQHRGYNEQIDEPMFWPVLQVRNEVVRPGVRIWLAARPQADGYLALGWDSLKPQAVARCTEPDDFVVPIDEGAPMPLSENHQEAGRPLAPNSVAMIAAKRRRQE